MLVTKKSLQCLFLVVILLMSIYTTTVAYTLISLAVVSCISFLFSFGAFKGSLQQLLPGFVTT